MATRKRGGKSSSGSATRKGRAAPRRKGSSAARGGSAASWIVLIAIAAAVVAGTLWWRSRQGGDEVAPELLEPATPAAEAGTPAEANPLPPPGSSRLALRTDAPGADGADAPLAPGDRSGVLRQVLDAGTLPSLTQGPYTPDTVEQVAEVAGTVRYRGMLVDEVVVPTVDGTACPEHPAGELVVEDGRLANALVWLEGVESGNRIASAGSLQVTGCDLQPKVAYYGVDSVVKLTNADDVIHDLVARDADGAELFRATLAPGEQRRPVPLPRAGLYRVTCERHPWERAALLVVPHPYVATTTTLGTFHLGAVPVPASGAVVLRVYHPALGTYEQTLELVHGHTMTLDVDLTEMP